MRFGLQFFRACRECDLPSSAVYRFARRFRGWVLSAGCVWLLFGCVASQEASREVDPKKAINTRLELGNKYLDAGNRDLALRQFLEVLDSDKKNAVAWQGLAAVHQQNREYKEAEKAFKKALAYSSQKDKADVQYHYAGFLVQHKRFAEAKKMFQAASKDLAYSRRAHAIYYAGRCELELGNTDTAEALFEHALNLRARLGGAALELADLAFAKREYDSAKRYLDHFESVSKPSARSLWLGIRIERIFGNDDKIASKAMALKNLFGYSKEYLEYQRLLESAE
jgi:type IV pilus assembly protein PilF